MRTVEQVFCFVLTTVIDLIELPIVAVKDIMSWLKALSSKEVEECIGMAQPGKKGVVERILVTQACWRSLILWLLTTLVRRKMLSHLYWEMDFEREKMVIYFQTLPISILYSRCIIVVGLFNDRNNNFWSCCSRNNFIDLHFIFYFSSDSAGQKRSRSSSFLSYSKSSRVLKCQCKSIGTTGTAGLFQHQGECSASPPSPHPRI